MSCERYRDALTDAAAGEPASPALEAHLAACGRCRSELAELRGLMAAADESLSVLAAAEPSQALRARIRAAVAGSESAPALRWGFAWPVAAAAVLALAAVGVWRATVVHGPVVPAVAEGVRPAPAAASTPRAAVTPPVVSQGERPRTLPPPPRQAAAPDTGDRGGRSASAAASVRVARGARTTEPEVLVPRGQQEALLQFVALVHRDCLVVPALAAAGAPSADLAEPAPIEIRPLEIAPLDPAEAQGI
jgi:hypothetical protein